MRLQFCSSDSEKRVALKVGHYFCTSISEKLACWWVRASFVLLCVKKYDNAGVGIFILLITEQETS